MSLKILLVDDNPGELRFLRTFFLKHPVFASYGAEVLEAVDGEQGFELFLRERPDLTFVDLLLPQMDGATLCGEIRRHQGGDSALLFAMSSIYRSDQVARELYDQLQVEFIPKPFDLELLPGRLLARLAESGVGGIGPAVPQPADAAAAGSVALDAAPVDFTRAAKGNIEAVSVPSLLVHAADQSATGTLRLSRGKLHKLIYLRDGEPVFVDSNVRNETLGAHLLGKKIIDDQALTAALKHSRAANLKLGEALVSLGLVDRQTIDAGLKAQARLKIATTLRWEDGGFQFSPGDDFSTRVPDCSFPVVPLVIGALERLRGRADLADLYGANMGDRLLLTPMGRRQLAAVGKAFGDAFRAVLLKSLTLAQLAEAGGDVAGALARVQALRECQLAEVRAPADHQAVGAARFSAEAKPSAGGLRQLATYAERAASESAQAPAAEPDPPELPADTIPNAPAVDAGASAQPDRGPEPRVDATLESWLEDKLRQIGRQTYYELLEIERSATSAQVDEAFEQLALRCDLARSEGADAEMCDFVRQELQQSYDLLADSERRAAYDDFLDTAQTVQPVARVEDMGAELAFREGQARLEEDRLGEAVAALSRAVESNPEQPDYLSLYGWALFRQRGGGEGGAAAARPHLRAALQLAPESAEVNERAGRVELAAGNLRQASIHLQQALKFGAPNHELYEEQRRVLLQLADYAQLEHLYRHMVYRLRDHDNLATLPFWLELVTLYRDKLGQPSDSELALSVVQKMAPDDPLVVEARENAEVVASTDWDAVCERLRGLADSDGADPAPLHDLVAVYQRTAQPERVLAVVSVLAARGEATDEQRALLDQLRPRALVRRDPLSAAEAQQLTHDADSPAVEQVVAQLSDLLCEAFPVPLEALGSAPDRRIDQGQLPASCASTIGYVADCLCVELPELYLSRTLDGLVVPRPERETALVISESLLQQADQRPLAFSTARALACLSLGRRHVFARSGNDLKTAFLAALSASQPGMPVSDPSGAVQRFRERILSDPDLLGRLAEAMQNLFAQGGRVNLSDWMRGVRRTSARVGLLACGDVLTALDQVGADPPIARDLIAFALSRPVGSACSGGRG